MDDELVGGLYGVSLGECLWRIDVQPQTDASKIALAHLVAQLKRWNFGMIDCR